MPTICTSSAHLLMHGPNQSFGNHVLHLFAVYAIAKRLSIDFKITSDSNLDQVFDLNAFKLYENPPCFFAEEYNGDVETYYAKESRNYQFTDVLLANKLLLPDIFQIQGWFWNSKLLPDNSFFETIKIKECNLEKLKNKNYIYDADTLVIHYRGTDFQNHAIGWGDIRLKNDYYAACIEDYRTKHKLKKLVIVSDDHHVCDALLHSGLDIIVEKNDYVIDWLLLLFCKNLVCSNSSFCYTAGWFDKNVVYQPNKFFTRYFDTDKHFPIDPYYKNAILK